jgi:hypothetical protein
MESSEKTFGPRAQRGGRHGIARQVIEAAIDEALDRAQVRSEQRERIYRARNRAFAEIEDYLEDGDAGLCLLVEAELREQIQRCFVSDSIVAAPFDWRRRRPDHRQVVEAIACSVREARGVLTPSQRQVIADYVRAYVGSRSIA